jgi:hypothetical protein
MHNRALGTLLLMIGTAGAAMAEDCRTLEQSFEADALERVEIEVSVGELRVLPASDGRVHVTVEVCPRNGWFRRNTVEKAELRADSDGETLELALNRDRYEEDWVVSMPAGLRLGADVGIGEVRIEGLREDIALDLGIGDLSIRGEAAHYGRVNGDVGIGEFHVDVPEENARHSRALVSASADWKSAGKAGIDADIGIGDAEITLR